MAEKPQLVNSQKQLDSLTLPVSSPTPSHPPPTKYHLFIRFCQAIFTLGFLYSFPPWLYYRFANQTNHLVTVRPWPTEAFVHHADHNKHDILNGHRAEQIFL
jgi:hypothetical protein